MILLSALALATSPIEAPATVVAEQSCIQAVDSYSGATSLVLANAVTPCLALERAEDAAFLLMLTKLRFAADIALFRPVDITGEFDSAPFVAAYAMSDDFVDETLARDPERFEAVMDRVRAAELSVPFDYQPGWTFVSDAKRDLYDVVVEGMRTDQLALEYYVARLVRDDAYFTAYQKRRRILASLTDERALPDEYGTMSDVMRRRVAVLGDPPEGSAVPWSRVYRPGPEAAFDTLAVGFDGPASDGTAIFESAGAVEQSWVGRVLGEAQLAQVLAEVDFTREVVGVYAVGEMQNATGNTIATHFEADREKGGYAFSVVVGVVGADCASGRTRSYPFVVATTARGTGTQITASSRANFPDQCQPVRSGRPIAVGDVWTQSGND
ncbi:MAG: hypothetical protein WA954_07420 [Parerythrobacter sp.]